MHYLCPHLLLYILCHMPYALPNMHSSLPFHQLLLYITTPLIIPSFTFRAIPHFAFLFNGVPAMSTAGQKFSASTNPYCHYNLPFLSFPPRALLCILICQSSCVFLSLLGIKESFFLATRRESAILLSLTCTPQRHNATHFVAVSAE